MFVINGDGRSTTLATAIADVGDAPLLVMIDSCGDVDNSENCVILIHTLIYYQIVVSDIFVNVRRQHRRSSVVNAGRRQRRQWRHKMLYSTWIIAAAQLIVAVFIVLFHMYIVLISESSIVRRFDMNQRPESDGVLLAI